MVGASGTYFYAVMNSCGNDVASFTVNVTNLPNAEVMRRDDRGGTR